jgi:hypothetical protein
MIDVSVVAINFIKIVDYLILEYKYYFYEL